MVYLAQDYPNTEHISKEELTEFIRYYFLKTNDVQQARHLAAQKGWYIASGTRKNGVKDLKPGYYRLVTLEKPFPSFTGHRIENTEDWEEIKKQYDYRCAVCGSKEGERHLHWKSSITKLTKGHKDPNKPLTKGNIIPHCEKCNRPDRNYWVYDEKGRVIKVASAKVILQSDETVQWEAYKLLYNKFAGQNPNE